MYSNPEQKENNDSSSKNNKRNIKQIMHDIRNYKSLKKEDLIHINLLPFKQRLEILSIYNDIVYNMVFLFETENKDKDKLV
jgi:hypothetical protein